MRCTSDDVQRLNRRAVEVLQQRLKKFESELLLIEDRCMDEDWVQAALKLTEHQFWLGEEAAWRCLIPRFVESLVYSRDLRRGLLQVAAEWKNALSQRGQKRLQLLQRGSETISMADPQGQVEMLDELERLNRLGWLENGDSADTAERKAILSLLRGRNLLQQANPEAAVEFFEQASQAVSDGGQEFRKQLADSFYEASNRLIWPSGSITAVSSELGFLASKQAVALNPGNGDAHYNLGCAYYVLEKKREAFQSYQQAIQLNPKNAYSHNGLGNVYADLGRYDEAIQAFQQSIQLDPNYAHPHSGLGNVYADLGRYDEAIHAFRQAIWLNPKMAYSYLGLGNVYAGLGRNDEAIQAFQQSIQLDPKDAAPYHGLGNVYADLGRNDEAIQAFQRAIQLDPKEAASHSGLSLIYMLLGHWPEALLALKRAIELDPQKPTYQASLVAVYKQLGREEEAAQQVEIARRLIAQANEYNQACFEAICGNVEEALTLLKTGLEKGQSTRDWAQRDPDFEALRDDPRFQALAGDDGGADENR